MMRTLREWPLWTTTGLLGWAVDLGVSNIPMTIELTVILPLSILSSFLFFAFVNASSGRI